MGRPCGGRLPSRPRLQTAVRNSPVGCMRGHPRGNVQYLQWTLGTKACAENVEREWEELCSLSFPWLTTNISCKALAGSKIIASSLCEASVSPKAAHEKPKPVCFTAARLKGFSRFCSPVKTHRWLFNNKNCTFCRFVIN